jgi:hypothetical protein
MDIAALRPGFVLLVVSIVAASASGTAAQQPAPAGANRPNLRVLQELPEAQLFPLMNLVADSLGVRCDYCHVQDKPDFTKTPSNVGGWAWSSDAKPPKAKAREMMRMVIELNRSQFGGAARITCYTCHRGTTAPARLPTLPPPGGSATTPAPVTLPSVDRVWANYLSAVGPLDAPARNTGTIMTGWDDRPEGRYGSVEITTAADRYRITLTTPTGTTTQGFDGDVAWTAANDRVQRLSGDDIARLRRIAMRYRPIKDRPANLQVVGLESIAGREAYVTTARINPTTTLALYFDVVTALLRREVTTTETLLLPLEDQVDYDDYRSVNGVQFPFLIRTTDGASYDLVTKIFLQIRRSVPVDDALFRPPGGGAR